MRYRTLGASGLKVSPLCLGTMMFGGPTDEPTATRIVAKAKDQGVNFIDTADGYTGGKSEEVTGRAIGNRAMTGCWRPSSATSAASGRTTAACRANG